jgi:hypothetical protein
VFGPSVSIHEVLLAPNAVVVEGELATLLCDVSPFNVVTDLTHEAFTAPVAGRRESISQVEVPMFVDRTVHLPELLLTAIVLLDSDAWRSQSLP